MVVMFTIYYKRLEILKTILLLLKAVNDNFPMGVIFIIYYKTLELIKTIFCSS